MGFNKQTIIYGGTIITPMSILTKHSIVIEGQRIVRIERNKRPSPLRDQMIDAKGLYVVPGFIDLHVHGSNGFDTMDCTREALHSMGKFLAKHGVSSYIPTTMSASKSSIKAAIDNIMSCPQPQFGAQHLGAHIEGPYLNQDYKGAQPVDYLREPDPSEYDAWLDSGVVRFITIAPEINGAHLLIEEGIKKGVEFSIGHSGASYDQVLAAADLGLKHATHVFNGMRGLHHREPGTAGGVLGDERIFAHVIVDGIHLHPAIVKLLVDIKGTCRTILITDAMRATGLSAGEFELGDQLISVKNGVALTESGSLAGSTLTMEVALQNVIEFTGLSLQDAIPMVTSAPARALGLEGKKGTLEVNADADIVMLDSGLNVQKTIVAGQVVYESHCLPKGGRDQ